MRKWSSSDFEEGIPGVPVVLERPVGSAFVYVRRTVTSREGRFAFRQVSPGRYRVRFAPPASHVLLGSPENTLEVVVSIPAGDVTVEVPAVRLGQ
jgi:hypothetical protein